jgi:nicotinamidase/pyrazinamidase
MTLDSGTATGKLAPTHGLILVDVQNDFMPGGALAVVSGNEIVPPLNQLIASATPRGATMVATRDWHPADHCSFAAQGGIWPPHCVAGTPGAEFHPGLRLAEDTRIVSKADTQDRDAYSGFDGTDLGKWLSERGIQHLLVGGLATDYCVLHTVLDGLKAGFRVTLLTDAIRAVNVAADDGAKAIAQMASTGAELGRARQFL